MRDDETAPVAGRPPAEEFARAAGPRHAARRHAAPRKSLLTKFQMPAGKAMMLAAMPTAVVVGMGLTPRLALADDNTGSAQANPCVSRSDEPSDADSPSASASDSAKPDPSASKSTDAAHDGKKADDGKKAGGSADPKPSATPSSTAPASHTPSPADSSAAAQDSDGGKSGGLLGGLGSAVGGLLGVHDSSAGSSSSDKASDTPAPDSSPSAGSTATSGSSASSSPHPSSSGSSDSSAKGDGSSSKDGALGSLLGGSASGKSKDGSSSKDKAGSKTVKGTVGGLSKAKANTAEAKTQAMKDLLKTKGIQYSDTADSKDATKADPGSCDDGPCDNVLPILKPPSQDANAPSMANDPWHLSSSKLSLQGLCYRGLVDIKTASGATKRVMKFTADSIGIGDLHQTVDDRDADGNIVRHTQIETEPGTTSTIDDGPVTMYTEKLSGNLLGLLPITFSPDFPPPIQIPSVFFTNAEVDQAGQFGGTLKMKGLHNYIG